MTNQENEIKKQIEFLRNELDVLSREKKTYDDLKDSVLTSLKETNKSLKLQNDLLYSRHKEKWGFFNIAAGLLTILFAVALGHQAFTSHKLYSLQINLEKKSERFNEILKDSKKSSEILAIISESLAGLYDASYTSKKSKEQKKAISIVNKVINSLNNGRKELPSTSPFIKSINAILFSSYLLKERLFFEIKDFEQMKTVADNMIELNPQSWQGYHFRAIHYLGKEVIEKDKAYEDLKKSVNLKPMGNRDYINLSELCLLNEEYENAKAYAETFLRRYEENPNQYTLIAEFYLALSGFMLEDLNIEQTLKQLLEDVEGKKYESVHKDLKEHYDSTSLKEIKLKIDDKIGTESPDNEVGKLVSNIIKKFM